MSFVSFGTHLFGNKTLQLPVHLYWITTITTNHEWIIFQLIRIHLNNSRSNHAWNII